MKGQQVKGKGTTLLDWRKVKSLLDANGMSCGDLKDKAGISRGTVRRIVDGQEIRPGTARLVADALDVRVLEILHPSKLPEQSALQGLWAGTIALPDWEREGSLPANGKASNGLAYEIWQLKHRFEKKRFARGKRYNTGALAVKEQERMQDYLVRHGDICNRLKGNARFPEHVTTCPDAENRAWWVVDEWIEGRTLADVLVYGSPLSRYELPIIMRQIAEGLEALHNAGIIRRELGPRFVILRATDNSVVLTDFELGKLLDDSPTVSGDWPEDRYRAPEVEGSRLSKDDYHVDLYSWGRILVQVATGSLPPRGKEPELIDTLELPDPVASIAKRCVAQVWEERPRTTGEVLKAIRKWK